MFKKFKEWYQEKNKDVSDFEYYTKKDNYSNFKNAQSEYNRKLIYYQFGMFPLSVYAFFSSVALTSLIYIIGLINIYPYLSMNLLKQLSDIRLIALGLVMSIIIPILIYEITLSVVYWSITYIRKHDLLTRELKNE